MISTDEFGNWRKSRHSGGEANCVEVASSPDAVGVRDSKRGPYGPVLRIAMQNWAVLAEDIKTGEFDLR